MLYRAIYKLSWPRQEYHALTYWSASDSEAIATGALFAGYFSTDAAPAELTHVIHARQQYSLPLKS